MDLNELAERMAALEGRNAEADAMAQQTSFMDKYGTKFSQDGDLGVAILGELNRRGIDVSAADSAVQEILDGLRMEATQLLDKIKADQAEVAASMEKINQIDEAVQAAQGNVAPATPPQPEAAPPPMDPMAGGMPMDPMAAGSMPPVDPMSMGMDPTAGGGGMPPVDASMMPPPPVPGDLPGAVDAVPPADASMMPPPPAPPPNMMLSDSRLKMLRSRVTPKPAMPQKPMFKPSAGLLQAAKGGM